jgi:hypothetical protein
MYPHSSPAISPHGLRSMSPAPLDGIVANGSSSRLARERIDHACRLRRASRTRVPRSHFCPVVGERARAASLTGVCLSSSMMWRREETWDLPGRAYISKRALRAAQQAPCDSSGKRGAQRLLGRYMPVNDMRIFTKRRREGHYEHSAFSLGEVVQMRTGVSGRAGERERDICSMTSPASSNMHKRTQKSSKRQPIDKRGYDICAQQCTPSGRLRAPIPALIFIHYHHHRTHVCYAPTESDRLSNMATS